MNANGSAGFIGSLVALVVLLLATAPTALTPTAAPPQEILLILVFDPTIYEPTDTTEMDALLDALGSFYSRIRWKTRVVAFKISAKMMNERDLHFENFKYRDGIDGPAEHRAAVATSFHALRGKLKAAWGAAQAPANKNTPTSCILTSLWTVQRTIKRMGVVAGQKIYVVMVTDLLEACDDWGKLRLDDGVSQLSTLKPAAKALGSTLDIDLSGIQQFILVRVPQKRWTSPQDISALEKHWGEILTGTLRLAPAALYLDTYFPADVARGENLSSPK